MLNRIHPSLWFDTEAEDAARFYTSIFENSRIVTITHYGEAGPREAGMVMTVVFELEGLRFMALNGGPQFGFVEAVSFVLNCADQAELDYYWDRLSEGGEPGSCGWLKDRFGLSWQIVPENIGELVGGEDAERARRAMTAMLTMGKLDIAALRGAAEGVPAG